MVAATMVAILMDSRLTITMHINSLDIRIMVHHINMATSSHPRSLAYHIINHDQATNTVDRRNILPESHFRDLHSVVVRLQEAGEHTLPICPGLQVMV